MPFHPVSVSPGCLTSVISSWQPLIRYAGSRGHTAHCQPVTRSPLCQTDTVPSCTRSPAQAVIASSVKCHLGTLSRCYQVSVSTSPSGPTVTQQQVIPSSCHPATVSTCERSHCNSSQSQPIIRFQRVTVSRGYLLAYIPVLRYSRSSYHITGPSGHAVPCKYDTSSAVWTSLSECRPVTRPAFSVICRFL